MSTTATTTTAAGDPAGLRAVAFYLPQFHRVAENDAWWGEGFTEWTNVRKAVPLYPGHDQPVAPGALGYYDLTDPAARGAQADLARRHGVEAFCYWHYWFGDGRRILEGPFDAVVASGEPDLPFCLCWANQSWTGIWHGAPGRVLMEQRYPGPEDHRAHFEAILPAFRDPRYLRVGGRPVFAIYAPNDLPDPDAVVALWRGFAEGAGLPGLYLVGMGTDHANPALRAFDRTLTAGPGDFLSQRPLSTAARVARRVAGSRAGDALGGGLRRRMMAPINHPYREVVEHALAAPAAAGPRAAPCVLPGWDNTPRSGRRGVVFTGATPALFERYARRGAELAMRAPPGERLMFVKAWNEWAEGNVLEPTERDGEAYLEALDRVVRDNPGA